ncbi:MAG: DUF3035 domain-containing protein [Sphingomonadaceae bacterium]|nr:DUF3035 domain-containing protein [Sphingomonadaceae bacterium]
MAMASLLALAGCGSTKGGVFSRARPNEFEVTRNAPLVVPPDYSLSPPKPGAPRPQESNSSTEALSAMFGGAAPRSTAENAILDKAGNSEVQPGARSTAGSPGTNVVDKGSVTRDIIAAPEGQGQGAQVSTPQQ